MTDPTKPDAAALATKLVEDSKKDTFEPSWAWSSAAAAECLAALAQRPEPPAMPPGRYYLTVPESGPWVFEAGNFDLAAASRELPRGADFVDVVDRAKARERFERDRLRLSLALKRAKEADTGVDATMKKENQ